MMEVDRFIDRSRTLDDLLEDLAMAAKSCGSMEQRRKISQENLPDSEWKTDGFEWEESIKQQNDYIESLKQEIKRIAEAGITGSS